MLLHFLQHACRDLGRRHALALSLDPGIAVVRLDDVVGHQVDIALHHVFLEAASDQALDGEQRILRIGDGLALGGLANQHLVVTGEAHDRWRGAVALAVLDHPDLAPLHHGDAGVGRAQVNSDYFAHFLYSPCNFLIYLKLNLVSYNP